jgi:hypothetical protein
MAISPSGARSVLGVKVSVAPLARQDPAVVGLRIGRGELLESGEDNVMVIGALAETPVVPFAGAIETTLSAGGAALVLPGDRPDWWLCPFALGDVR